jgi:ABC-type bacteriocin/lantibiotic exporter with double-glycine peptidase domain
MVLASFGVTRSEEELRDLCDCTIFGTSAIELVEAARALGFAGTRKYSVTLEDLKDFATQGYYPIVYVALSDLRAYLNSSSAPLGAQCL